MPVKTPRTDWAIEAARVGLRLEEIALVTGKSYFAVYRYSTGSRRPTPEWLAQVAALIANARYNLRQPQAEKPGGGLLS
jgi:hypothetical protein